MWPDAIYLKGPLFKQVFWRFVENILVRKRKIVFWVVHKYRILPSLSLFYNWFKVLNLILALSPSGIDWESVYPNPEWRLSTDSHTIRNCSQPWKWPRLSNCQSDQMLLIGAVTTINKEWHFIIKLDKNSYGQYWHSLNSEIWWKLKQNFCGRWWSLPHWSVSSFHAKVYFSFDGHVTTSNAEIINSLQLPQCLSELVTPG